MEGNKNNTYILDTTVLTNIHVRTYFFAWHTTKPNSALTDVLVHYYIKMSVWLV